MDYLRLCRSILHETLLLWQMNPTVTEGGPAALAVLEQALDRRTSFPLILLDAQMPDMDGFSVAGRIAQNAPLTNAAVIMLTSGGVRGNAGRCRELGIRAYLPKPIKRSDLLAAIRIALGSQNQSQKSPSLVTVHSLRENRGRLNILVVEEGVSQEPTVAQSKQGQSEDPGDTSRAAFMARKSASCGSSKGTPNCRAYIDG